jgi:hypothetical protein
MGGIWVLWIRSSAIYAQHIHADGSLEPGWPIDGHLVIGGFTIAPRFCTDGAGTVYYTKEKVTSYDSGEGWYVVLDYFYVFRANLDGVLAPGWPIDGVEVPVGSSGKYFKIIPDPTGGVDCGAIYEACSGPYGCHYATAVTRIQADGTAPYAGGAESGSPGYQLLVFAPDGPGGIEFSYLDGKAFTSYAKHYSSNGSSLWPTQQFSTSRYVFIKQLVSLGSQGAVLIFSDLETSSFTRAQVWLNNGSLAPGWSTRGTLVRSANVEPQSVGMNGGVLFTWNESHPGTLASDIYALVLTSAGSIATGWMAEGSPVCAAAGDQFSATPVADGVGGAYIFWLDRRDGTANQHIYAQRIGSDGPVATQASLVRAESVAGRVTLEWFSSELHGASLPVERSSGDQAWSNIGTASFDGTGHAVFEDSDVVAGGRYGYHLVTSDAEGTHTTGEAWVTVPAVEFALEGARPCPAVGPLRIAFALPDARPASLELFDLHGRRLAAREVGSLGAGRHVVDLSAELHAAPGVYFVRLRHGGRSLQTRVAVLK